MYIFIVNPHARSGLGHVVWDELESILKKQNIPYKAYFTKYQKHATEIARKATSDDAPSTLVVLGGDGTINEVVNGIPRLRKGNLGVYSNWFKQRFRQKSEYPLFTQRGFGTYSGGT